MINVIDSHQENEHTREKRLNDLVFVKCNQALKSHYDRYNVIDLISLEDIDESNEWLVVKIGEEDITIHAKDDLEPI